MSEQKLIDLKLQKWLAFIPFFGLIIVLLCAIINIKRLTDWAHAAVFYLLCAVALFASFLLGGLAIFLISNSWLVMGAKLALDLVMAFAIFLTSAFVVYFMEKAELNKIEKRINGQ